MVEPRFGLCGSSDLCVAEGLLGAGGGDRGAHLSPLPGLFAAGTHGVTPAPSPPMIP